MFKTKTIWIAATVLVLAGGAFAIYENHALNAAHSTFENYYAFRGCSQLLEKTESSAKCKLRDDSIITIVKINDKWYLEGDGPGRW